MGNCTMRVYQALGVLVLASCRPSRPAATDDARASPRATAVVTPAHAPRAAPTLVLSDRGFCEIDGARKLRCGGQFGAGALMSDRTTRAFASGARYGCAVLADQTLRCWGQMFSTGITYPAPSPREPAQVDGVGDIDALYATARSLVARVARGALRWVYTAESERSDLANAQRPRVLAIEGVDRVTRFEWLLPDQLAVAERDDHTWFALRFEAYAPRVAVTNLGPLGEVTRWTRRERPCALRADATVACVPPSGGMAPLRAVAGVRDAIALADAGGLSTIHCAQLRGGAVRCWDDGREPIALLPGAVDLRHGAVELTALRGARSVVIQGSAVCGALERGALVCVNVALERPSQSRGLWGRSRASWMGARTAVGITHAQALEVIDGAPDVVCAIGDGASGRCVQTVVYAETAPPQLPSYAREAFDSRRGLLGDDSQEQMRCRAQPDRSVRCSPWLTTRLARATEDPARYGVPVFGVGDSRVLDVALDRDGGCAILDDERRSARCWSMDTEDASPVSALADAVEIAPGRGFRCARDGRGAVRCWGDGRFGQRGDGALGVRAGADTVALSEGALELTAGVAHACARMNDGTVRCWGWNEIAQLGDRTLASSATPVTVPGLRGVRSLRAGSAHTCALLDDRSVRCWGNNSDYECGVERPSRVDAPVEVSAMRGASEIAVNGGVSCARFDRPTDTVRCWGRGSALVLPPTQAMRRDADAGAAPWWQVTIAELDGARSLYVGPSRICGRMADGRVRCVDSEYVLE